MPRDEDAVHVALVGEARLGRGISQRRTLPDQAPRLVEATLHGIGMGRQPLQAREAAHRLEAANPGQRGEVRQTMEAGGSVIDPLTYPRQLPAYCAFRPLPDAEQAVEQCQQPFLERRHSQRVERRLKAGLLGSTNGVTNATSVVRQSQLATSSAADRPILYILGRDAALTTVTKKGVLIGLRSTPATFRVALRIDYLWLGAAPKRAAVNCLSDPIKFDAVSTDTTVVDHCT